MARILRCSESSTMLSVMATPRLMLSSRRHPCGHRTERAGTISQTLVIVTVNCYGTRRRDDSISRGVAMTDSIVLDSLQRRMRAMHSLYYDAVSTMELDQVNHFEREGVLPIAFSLFHLAN